MNIAENFLRFCYSMRPAGSRLVIEMRSHFKKRGSSKSCLRLSTMQIPADASGDGTTPSSWHDVRLKPYGLALIVPKTDHPSSNRTS
jgi:hypothetical protein